MKILMAYDGSKSSDNVIDDLQFAGFPKKGVEILVMSVAEVWMPPPPAANNGDGFKPEEYPVFIQEWTERHLEVAKNAVTEAETLSSHAKTKIKEAFPGWETSSFSTYGSPAWEILSKSSEFEPDLITMGSHGRNAVGRILLGSVSQKVLTEAQCSVRIARFGTRDQDLPNRILIGFDGSKGAEMAVDAVAGRKWKKGTEVKLVSAVQSLVPSTIGRFIPPVTDWIDDDLALEKQLMEKLFDGAVRRLKKSGLKTFTEIQDGNPKQILTAAAESWNAASIFIGAHAFTSEITKYLIGCTSAAIAERANCSVEAVR